MKKLTSLRAAVLKSPLKIDPKNLLTFAEKGSVKSWRGAGTDDENRAFMVAYTANLIVTDYAKAPQDLFFVVSEWVHAHCPDADPEESIRFQVDMIDHEKSDVSLAIDITEIIATPKAAGGKVKISPAPDPDVGGMDMSVFHPGMA